MKYKNEFSTDIVTKTPQTHTWEFRPEFPLAMVSQLCLWAIRFSILKNQSIFNPKSIT